MFSHTTHLLRKPAHVKQEIMQVDKSSSSRPCLARNSHAHVTVIEFEPVVGTHTKNSHPYSMCSQLFSFGLTDVITLKNLQVIITKTAQKKTYITTYIWYISESLEMTCIYFNSLKAKRV